MKREKRSLGEKVAVICEGGAETAIMEMLLDAGRLIFTENDLFYGEIIRCRSAQIFEQRYLKIRMDFKLTIIRVLDSRRENFRLSRPYCDEVDIINVITAPEFLMVNIIGGAEDDVIMGVSLICVGCDNIGKPTLQKFVRKFDPDEMCLFMGDLTFCE